MIPGDLFGPSGKKYIRISYAADPHQPVRSRQAVVEEIDVIILGAGWGGIMAAHHLTQAGVTNFRNVDTAGDFGGVWYWNRYPGIQCDNESYCYLPLLEEMGFMPSKKFADGWEIESLQPTQIEVNPEFTEMKFSQGGPKAWFTIVRRKT